MQPSGAAPHHLVLIADPQLVDAHTYPGRPWPLSALTVLVTDNYLRRSYGALQRRLRPDSVVFLGDLFDGGREWKTEHGDFADPEYAKGHRPAREQKYVGMWNKRYGERYWLREYERFGDIFFRPFARAGGSVAGAWSDGSDRGSSDEASLGFGKGQRGRRLIASLPGNHDLGFGSEVKTAVRDRFQAYFGESNRVDVIGNHTIVSVDTVSLSADTSDEAADGVDLRHIFYEPELFLKTVQARKRKAVQRELRWMRGEMPDPKLPHLIEEPDDDEEHMLPRLPPDDPGKGAAEFPTILLTHVPLYREPGTPCGPLREHWPPSKQQRQTAASAGDSSALIPDTRNAIPIARGYQYQNVLSEEDSVRLVRQVGGVSAVFSGDDHDYCDVVHPANKNRAREITVKSISMAMGIRTPGFLLVSLWNPVDPVTGRPLRQEKQDQRAKGTPTLQTHLCLLPNQTNTYTRYAIYALFTLIILGSRALLVPVLRLTPFALEPEDPAELRGLGAGDASARGGILPTYHSGHHHHHSKAKMEDHDEHGSAVAAHRAASSSSAAAAYGATVTGKGARSTPLASPVASPAGGPGATGGGSGGGGGAAASRSFSGPHAGGRASPPPVPKKGKSRRSGGGGSGKWGWGDYGYAYSRREPKIEIRAYDDDVDSYGMLRGRRGVSLYWRAASARRSLLSPRSPVVRLVVREMWTTTWRVAWMAGLFWAWLAWKG